MDEEMQSPKASNFPSNGPQSLETPDKSSDELKNKENLLPETLETSNLPSICSQFLETLEKGSDDSKNEENKLTETTLEAIDSPSVFSPSSKILEKSSADYKGEVNPLPETVETDNLSSDCLRFSEATKIEEPHLSQTVNTNHDQELVVIAPTSNLSGSSDDPSRSNPLKAASDGLSNLSCLPRRDITSDDDDENDADGDVDLTITRSTWVPVHCNRPLGRYSFAHGQSRHWHGRCDCRIDRRFPYPCNFGEGEPSCFQYDSNEAEANPWAHGYEESEPVLVGAGLANLGNTCFLNAVLQCITHTVPLVRGLCSENQMPRSCGHGEGFCVLCAFCDHIKESLETPEQMIFPYNLVNNMSYKLDSCWWNHLKDSTDVFPKDDGLVKQVFGGCLVSQLRCCNCGHNSDTYEPLIDLSLEIEHVDNLSSALESFTKVETIEDTEIKFTCEGCKQQVLVEKQLKLDEAPSVVVFHLKRFKSDGLSVEKIDKDVNYPLVLDLKPYAIGSQSVDLKYELYAIVVHIGLSSTSGHYSSYIRSAPDTWYWFDDSKVRQVPGEVALSQEAYILFYAKKGTPWPCTLIETSRRCLLNNSPNSVLDNVDQRCAPNCYIANQYFSNVRDNRDVIGEPSMQSCDGRKPDGVDMSGETHGDQVEMTGHPHDWVGTSGPEHDEAGMSGRVNAQESAEVNNSNDIVSNNEKECSSSPRGKSTWETVNENERKSTLCLPEENSRDREVNDVGNNADIHPCTPPRSPSPDIYSEEPPEASYQIPRNHLKAEHGAPLKKSMDKAMHDLKRKEAMKYVRTRMPSCRHGLMVYLDGSRRDSNKKRNASSFKAGRSPVRTRH
ncbi:hypothetical protein Nepgr_024438 [Nepenthes gracilis]|uniref:Ubiquitin carboxyl-terminal hydrolase n=1 Tax=Nepenthes gracilis TaxID=150966 RepID=A0AAD3T335_NEPGR|nr:hypothetical protein Nepgr_024438 [Nepenthes gracilis]